MSLLPLHSSLIAMLLLLQSSLLNASGQPDPTAMQQVGDYSRMISTLVEGAPFELGAVIESTGSDPQSIYNWVRKNIRFESYTGIMKGAQGTLVSGGGNAADQALLLASLFEYAGIPASVVHGRIVATDLPVSPGPAVEQTDALPSAELMESLSKQTGIDRERLYAVAEGIWHKRQTFLEKLWSRTLNDLEVMSGALDAAGLALPKPMPGGSAAEVDHWWVSTPGGTFDPVTGMAVSSSAEGESYALDAIPDGVFHQVRFRMWIQKKEGAIDDIDSAASEPESVLDMTFRCGDLFGETLSIGSVPLDAQSTLSRLKHPTPDQVLQALATSKQFQPQLITSFGVRSGHPFDKSGNKLQVKEGRIESVQKIGGSMGGLWGGMSGEKNEETKSHLVAHWLEIVLIAPESSDHSLPPVTIRRDILRNPASETCSLEILTTREILLLPDELSSAWLSRRSLAHMGSMADHVDSTLRNVENLKTMNAVELIQQGEKRPHLTQTLYGFGLARKNELLRLRDRVAPQSRLLNHRPGMVSMVTGFQCPDGGILTQHGLDILHNAFEVEGPAPKSWKESLPFAAGILDTALELTLMESLHAPKDILNASLALEESAAAGRKPLVLLIDDGIQLQIMDSAGKRVLAYYTVDPLTGMSLGMMDGGGQAMAEYAEQVAIYFQLRSLLNFYGDLFKCIGLGITYPLSGGTHAAEMAFASCVFNIACGQITSLVGTFVGVDTTWTNVILQESVNELFNGVCSSISNKLFN